MSELSDGPVEGHPRAELDTLRRELARARAQLQDAEAEVLRLAGRAARSARLEREGTAQSANLHELHAQLSRETQRVSVLQQEKLALEARVAAALDEAAAARMDSARAERARDAAQVEAQRAAARLGDERERTHGAEEQLEIERRAAEEVAARLRSLEEAVSELALARDRAEREKQGILDGQRDVVSELNADRAARTD